MWPAVLLYVLAAPPTLGPAFRISNGPGNEGLPTAAWSDAGFLVAWNRASAVELAVVDAPGTVRRLPPTGLASDYAPGVTQSGAGWLLGVRTGFDIGLASVSAEGNLGPLTNVGTSPYDYGIDPRALALASSGNEAVAAWSFADLGGDDDNKLKVYRFPVAAVDAGTTQVIIGELNAFDGPPVATAWIGGRVLASWVPIFGVRVEWVDSLSSMGAELGASAGRVGVGSSGSVALVAYASPSGASADIVGVRYGDAGQALDAQPTLLTGTAGADSDPVVSWDGTCFMVLFASGGDVVASCLEPTNPAPTVVVAGDSSLVESEHWIASSPTGVSLALWSAPDPDAGGERRVFARLLRASGQTFDGGAGDGGSMSGDAGSVTGDGGSLSADGGSASGDAGSATGDAGSASGDAGSTSGDGGSATDDGGSPQQRGPYSLSVGCGCTGANSSAWLGPVALVALARGRRRRGRTHEERA